MTICHLRRNIQRPATITLCEVPTLRLLAVQSRNFHTLPLLLALFATPLPASLIAHPQYAIIRGIFHDLRVVLAELILGFGTACGIMHVAVETGRGLALRLIGSQYGCHSVKRYAGHVSTLCLGV